MFSRILDYIHKYDTNLWVLSFGWFVAALGFAVSIPFIAIYFHSTLGMSLSQIGFFFGALAIIRSIFQLVGGEISDHMERRQLLIYSQLFRVGAFLLLSVSISLDWGFYPIAAAMVISSVFGAIFQPVANAMVSDILPKEKRLNGYAITRAAGNLGWAAGPAMGGFLAATSYGLLFMISAVITLLSSLIFLFWLKSPDTESSLERFRLRDLLAIKDDTNLAVHCSLILLLYLVVAQLIAPFSVYAVDMVGISQTELGYLYTLNGLMVVVLQLPITTLLARASFTTQLAWGGIIYAIGYGLVGVWSGFGFFAIAIAVVTFGEIIMSPPSLALTSRLAPPGRMGRYMGIFGFFVATGWSMGPLYGGLVLDHLADQPLVAWMTISSLAILSAIGYMMFKRKLPRDLNYKH